jgi:HEAT repeat protein
MDFDKEGAGKFLSFNFFFSPLLPLLFCIFLLFSFGNLLSIPNPAERIYAHILIHDYATACEEAIQLLKANPRSETLWAAYIKALAKNGDEKGMNAAWMHYISLCPHDSENREILEAMAWGVIEQASLSSSPIIRTFAVMGAYFGQDAKGVKIILKSLRDSNNFLRAITLELASRMKDAIIQDEVLRMLRKESVWNVRMEAVKAAGMMKITDAKEDLIAILSDEKNTAEEKSAAIKSLVTIIDTAQSKDVANLATSNRAGLRLLACQLVEFFDLKRDIALIMPLLSDTHSEVRAAAIKVLGVLRIRDFRGRSIKDLISESLNQQQPNVGISAAWLLTLNDPSAGQEAFYKWLNHDQACVRHLASAALAATGKFGFPLTLTAFREHNDPYVKMNLALTMISQRKNCDEACDALYRGLTTLKERWMWDEDENFKILTTSTLKFDEGAVPNYPDVINQNTRLEILNILAIMKYPKALDAAKSFLRGRSWGISGQASALLLTEGDESALEIVEHLMNDCDQQIKVQAAFVLSLWGKGESAISILENSYKEADRELKERILEAIGNIGSRSSIPFLVDKMREPSQMLRIIAASALLNCLYH